MSLTGGSTRRLELVERSLRLLRCLLTRMSEPRYCRLHVREAPYTSARPVCTVFVRYVISHLGQLSLLLQVDGKWVPAKVQWCSEAGSKGSLHSWIDVWVAGKTWDPSPRYRVPTIFWYWNSRTFQWLSRTLKFHFQGPILDGSLQHE